MAHAKSKVLRPGKESSARENQQLRTRQDLLRAAARLMKGRSQGLTLEDVAAEALVSRATAYRYFPSVDALLVEAPLDAEVPQPEELFAGVKSDDVAERLDLAEAALHAMVYANRPQLRAMLAHSLTEGGKANAPLTRGARQPVRQNRRLPLIEAALAPARKRFSKATYEKLCASLALVFGTESMVVLTDVHPIGEADARRVKSWAIRALVAAAWAESKSPK